MAITDSLSGRRLELLVDRYPIDTTRRLEQRLEQPRDEGPVFHFSEPWEGVLSGYSTVIADPAAGDFKLYYRGLSDGRMECRAGEVTCLATSQDGIHWQRPKLQLHGWEGLRSTNIILADQIPDSHNFTPFLDHNPAAASEERFKALGGVAPIGLHAYVSQDGVHWRRRYPRPVLTKGMLDSQNVAFWSEHEQTYVCYLRTWTGEGFSGIRTISRSTSADFKTWTRPKTMRFGRRPLEHLYTNQTQPYPGAPQIYLGLAARFLPDRQVLTFDDAQRLQVDPEYYQDCSDVVLITSRGGLRYSRTVPEAFVKPGIGLEHWVSRTNFPALGLVRTGPMELSFYMNRHYAQPGAHLCRYSLPLDRIGYLEARHPWGEMVSKIIKVNRDDDLLLNLATSAAGGVQVALVDEQKQPIPGFGWDECGEIIGNDLSRAVRWSQVDGKRKLGDVGLASVRLHIRLRDARLYAFCLQAFADRP
jgi:hypothetical protein